MIFNDKKVNFERGKGLLLRHKYQKCDWRNKKTGSWSNNLFSDQHKLASFTIRSRQQSCKLKPMGKQRVIWGSVVEGVWHWFQSHCLKSCQVLISPLLIFLYDLKGKPVEDAKHGNQMWARAVEGRIHGATNSVRN